MRTMATSRLAQTTTASGITDNCLIVDPPGGQIGIGDNSARK
jgi:hypothetical protein